MLLSLYVENVALIKKLNMDIESGFTVLTGETGGGKSIIVDSLSLLCGSRGDRSLIRTGEEYAFVEGLFNAENTALGDDAEFLDSSGHITVNRRINADGRTVCKAGGKSVSVARLKGLVSKLLNIHGQQDTQALSDSGTHLPLLDAYTGDDAELFAYGAEYNDYAGLKNQVAELESLTEDKLLRLDTLEFQINELENAGITTGEEAGLESEKAVLVNAEKILLNAKTALDALDGGNGAGGRLHKAAEALGKLEGMLDRASGYAKRLEYCYYEITDIADSIKADIVFDTEFPEKRIDEIEERLAFLSRLKRKYRADEGGLLDKLESLKAEKESLDRSDDSLLQMKKALIEKETGLRRRGEKLTAQRKISAAKLKREVERHLSTLDMPAVTFDTAFETIPFTAAGIDAVEFLISANAGEETRPIARIASGGELSRIMLSIKTAFSALDGVKTVVFDEIDAGISGKTSEKLGLKLKALAAAGVQILCVTHSPQIASLADTHILVSKSEEEGRTYTRVRRLDYEGRVNEIARIIGGIKITEAVKAASREAISRGLQGKL